ncbi:calponin homology domain-containing protein [Mycena latifolia]|nr:calponin homology domain-containing protein [Mycena latifolia]
MAGASRTEFLAWLNKVLQINYTKVEQCGGGGAYLQVLESLYLDVPMGHVKMGTKQEYEYVANYKIMQNIFNAKKIDKPIPVEKFIKCKMHGMLGRGHDSTSPSAPSPLDSLNTDFYMYFRFALHGL